MTTNIDQYKADLNALISKGDKLMLAMYHECLPDQFFEAMEKEHGTNAKSVIGQLPSFKLEYQSWYSEARRLIEQILPGRITDFVGHYEVPKGRKQVTYDTYRIADYLLGLNVTRGYQKEKVVGPDAAIPQFEQQFAILKSVGRRFESSLFDLQQLAQADMFDSELDAAAELARHKFFRAAGAVAGVVLEKHLSQVCRNHQLVISKKNPTISDFLTLLKEREVLDVPQWRFVQHLADIRNMCDHDKVSEPTVTGVKKVMKTLF